MRRMRDVSAGLAVVALALAIFVAADSGAIATAEDGRDSLPPLLMMEESRWPLEMEFTVRVDGVPQGSFRFAGNYWNDYSWETLDGEYAGECFIRKPSQSLFSIDGCDGELADAGPEEPDDLYGPASYIWPGAAMYYHDLFEADHPGTDRASTDRRTETRAEGYLARCNERSMEACAANADSNGSRRVTFDVETGLPVTIQQDNAEGESLEVSARIVRVGN